MAAMAMKTGSGRGAGWMVAGVIASAAALSGVGGLGGCHTPGGIAYSADRYTYVSTEWQPYTISLVDTTTGETVWTVDVPVGKQLFMAFRTGSGPNEFRPDMLDWQIEEAGRLFGTPRNQIPSPGRNTRRVEVELRPVPERPTNVPPPPLNAQGSANVDG